eukprot:CAMPEP_0195526176 /NCGR_PEP_ID=MMETSP0794_2-20130614/27082_1 /TAXON_ID=515487 /ORGANISM="Stephanopyxis turris, Strain CCMP 815" /LENGTH=262 /DNA_ID=CAMNT_0040656801 /DNA_START=68 /DNA_END=856 /DNA_ORIENTATION=-
MACGLYSLALFGVITVVCLSATSVSGLAISVSDTAAKTKFQQRYLKVLPPSTNIVALGGYHNLQTLSSDPKSTLVSILVAKLKSTDGQIAFIDDDKIDALVTLLECEGKGFDADLVDDEWAIVFSRQGKKSPKFQKLVEKKEKAKMAFSNFDVRSMEFVNLNSTPRGNGELKAVVKYNPVSENYSKSPDDNIVIRRISCDIVDVSFKYWKLPKISIPLRPKGGYLDFLYLDNDVRITRGNRGGLFIHFRPAFLDKVMTEAAE